MADTVRGMISNFLDNVKQLGYVPNGGRIYYERSQPPLLLPMVDGYYESSKDVDFIRDNSLVSIGLKWPSMLEWSLVSLDGQECFLTRQQIHI